MNHSLSSPVVKPSHSLEGSNHYLPFIDGLRAIAVLSVIIFHLQASWMPGGFLGVDLFFIISGYVVSRAASQISAASLQPFLLDFYARRMARIIPPLLACLVATFVFTVLFIPPAWLTQTIDKTGLWAYLGLSNIVLSHAQEDYFSPIAELNPFTHTWSLGIEEQFYLVFALIFFSWMALRTGIIFLITGVIAFASLGYAVYMLHHLKVDYFSSLIRGWELAFGVLLFQWQVIRSSSLKPPHALAVPARQLFIIFCAISILAAFFLISPSNSTLLGVLWIALPTLALLHLCQNFPNPFQQFFLENKVSRFIGKMSYSLYLWHWPIFVGCKWTIGLEGMKEKSIALAATIICSVISYFLIEIPTRYWLKKVRSVFCILICVLGTMFCYWISLQLINHKSEISLSKVVRNQAMWYPNAIFNSDPSNPCVAQIKTKILNGSTVWIYELGNACASVKQSSRTLFILGDSHALQYRAMLAEFTSRTGISTHLYSNGGCPFMSLLPDNVGHSESCREFTRTSYADIQKVIRKDDLLFLSSLRMLRRVDQWAPLSNLSFVHAKMHSLKTQEVIKAEILEFEKLLTPLSNKGVSVIFSAPTPTWGFVPFRCEDWFNDKNPICSDNGSISKEEFSKLRAPIMQALLNLTHSLPDAKIWDALPILCPNAECKTKYEGHPLYFDGDHLSGYANTLLEPSFERLILGPSKPQSPLDPIHVQ